MQPLRSYLVCATPRSGSTLFCEILSNTDIAGRPKEYFEMLIETGLPRQPQQYFEPNDEHADVIDMLGRPLLHSNPAWFVQWGGENYARYLTHILEEGTTSNAVFGAKMMWGYFADFSSSVRQVPAYADPELTVPELLARIFPRLQYIRVTRLDKARQAVSLWKAIQTQQWREDVSIAEAQHEAIPQKKSAVFNFSALRHLERQIIAHEAAWQNYFAASGIQPLVIVYEELIDAFEETMQRVFQYPDIPEPEKITRPPMQRQADAQSEDWVQQYQYLKQAQEDGSVESVA